MLLAKLKGMPGHLIRRAHQKSMAIFAEEMAAFDITSVQFIALVAIAETADLDATRLADMIHFDRATIGGVLERMEAKGLIHRTARPGDKRIKVLHISPAGREVIDASFAAVERVQERLLEPLSAGEARLLTELLECVVAGART